MFVCIILVSLYLSISKLLARRLIVKRALVRRWLPVAGAEDEPALARKVYKPELRWARLAAPGPLGSTRLAREVAAGRLVTSAIRRVRGGDARSRRHSAGGQGIGHGAACLRGGCGCFVLGLLPSL
jgi:hypothetical protein